MGSMNREIKKISEDIKTNTFKQFYLFYGEEKYMILQMKDQLKRALLINFWSSLFRGLFFFIHKK